MEIQNSDTVEPHPYIHPITYTVKPIDMLIKPASCGISSWDFLWDNPLIFMESDWDSQPLFDGRSQFIVFFLFFFWDLMG
jgi:hypothetical protein